MAQRHFSFDDEESTAKKKSGKEPAGEQEFHFDEGQENEVVSAKNPKTKRKLKTWHVVITIIAVVVVIGVISLFAMTRENGPVYGNRCEGLLSLKKSYKDTAISKMKSEHSSVSSISMETACRTLKIDIVYTKGTSAAVAERIAQDAIVKVDEASGRAKVSGSSYSDLFGKYNNKKQYEVDFFLTCEGDNSDYPIYGVKQAGTDSISFTLSSVKDRATYNKATK